MTRPVTAKARLREWGRFVAWMQVREAGLHWPTAVHNVTDYLHENVAEGAAPSMPGDFLASLRWMEARAGFADDQNFGHHPSVTKTVSWARGELDEEVVRVRKAVPFMVGQVVSMELYVVNESHPDPARLLVGGPPH